MSDSFAAFQFNPRLMANIESLGFEVPTPIQVQAIPLVMQGRDVLGLAQTGTGKTAAFALPILQRLFDGPHGRTRVLILAPTRELAEQTHQAFGVFGAGTRVRSATVYGGVGMMPQVEALRRGVEVIVACPGRFLDLMEHGHGNFAHVDVLVLDEADQMFDMGFLPTVRKIIKRLPAKRQALMFSATMPDDIRRLAHEILHEPATVQVGTTTPVATVSHALYPVPSHLKPVLLQALLKMTDTESVLVFTRTKHRAKKVGDQLQKAGFRAASIQGNLSQNRRQEAMDGFRAGKYQILVATDIAARGIDVSRISHVINFDIPDTVDAYTHRIGRTGRAAKTGDAFTLVTSEDTDMVRAIERALRTTLERREIEGFDYRAAAPAATELGRMHIRPPPRYSSRTPRRPEAGAARPAHESSRRDSAPPARRPEVHPRRDDAPRPHRDAGPRHPGAAPASPPPRWRLPSSGTRRPA